MSKDWLATATLQPEDESPVVDKIFDDEVSIRRFFKQFRSPGRVAVCYEAGPTGYELHRLLSSMGVACEVVAPSLDPKSAGRAGQDRHVPALPGSPTSGRSPWRRRCATGDGSRRPARS